MAELAENLIRLDARMREIFAAGQMPILLLDLDDTLNRGYGANIEPAAAQTLARVHATRVLFGLNTGAPIEWAGLRVFCRLSPGVRCTLSLLATGEKAYAWSDALGAYLELPLCASSKGEGMQKLTTFLRQCMPGCPPRFVYIGDFPGPQNAAQPGIDDSVVLQAGEALSAVVNVGEGRAGTLRSSRETLFLGPPRSALRGAGKGVEATLQYLTGLAALLSEPPHRRALERLQAEFSRALVRTLALAAPPPGVVPGVLHLDRSSGLARWPHGSLRRAGDEAAIIRLGHPALVHAGVRDIRGRWVRIYDLFLEPSASVAGTWEAVLPLDADVFTLVHYELAGRGQARWEGIDYRLA